MAVSGAKWVCNKADIINALKKSGGRVIYASQMLNVCRETLTKRIRETPGLPEILQEMRHDFDEMMQDAAESAIMYALSQKEQDVPSSLKAAFYLLNNKGLSRGYSIKNNPNHQQPQGLTLDDVKQIAGIIENRKRLPGPREVG